MSKLQIIKSPLRHEINVFKLTRPVQSCAGPTCACLVNWLTNVYDDHVINQ